MIRIINSGFTPQISKISIFNEDSMEFKVAGFSCFWSWQLHGVQCILEKKKMYCHSRRDVLQYCSKLSYHLTHYAKCIACYRNHVVHDEEKNNKFTSAIRFSIQLSRFCVLYFNLHLITMCKKIHTTTNLSVSCLHWNKNLKFLLWWIKLILLDTVPVKGKLTDCPSKLDSWNLILENFEDWGSSQGSRCSRNYQGLLRNFKDQISRLSSLENKGLFAWLFVHFWKWA